VRGQVETARMLIARGARIEAEDDFGDTPSVLASRRGMQPMLELLRGAA
jgi:ankyrin repeat protein